MRLFFTRQLLIVVVLLAVASIASTQTTLQLPSNFDVQGHRGARGLKPENTLPAFETALDLGVNTLELDLHFSDDGVVVIWHDDEIVSDKCHLPEDSPVDAPDPESDSTQRRDLMLSNLTLEQIQAYRCDLNPDSTQFREQDNDPTPLAGDAYHILTLDELFTFVADYAASDEKTEEQRSNAEHVYFNIETKRNLNPQAIGDDFDGVNAGAFELAILATIEAHNLEARVIIQSFDHRSLWAVHQVNPEITLAALTFQTLPDFEGLAANGASIWSPNYGDLTYEAVDTAHELGLLVIPWTINDVAMMQILIEGGVDGIITDRPDLLLSSQAE